MTTLTLAQGLRMVLHLTPDAHVGAFIICKDSLTDEEQRFLKKVADRYRNRS